jgi:hypothetical protein
LSTLLHNRAIVEVPLACIINYAQQVVKTSSHVCLGRESKEAEVEEAPQDMVATKGVRMRSCAVVAGM